MDWFTAGYARLLHADAELAGRHVQVVVTWISPKAWADTEHVVDPGLRTWAAGYDGDRGDRGRWDAYVRFLGLEVTVLRMPDKTE
jgi:hypothetical protein